MIDWDRVQSFRVIPRQKGMESIATLLHLVFSGLFDMFLVSLVPLFFHLFIVLHISSIFLPILVDYVAFGVPWQTCNFLFVGLTIYLFTVRVVITQILEECASFCQVKYPLFGIENNVQYTRVKSRRPTTSSHKSDDERIGWCYSKLRIKSIRTI